MSLAGRARTQGARLAVYRPTMAANSDGSDRPSWALVTHVQSVVAPIDASVAREVFGADVRTTTRLVVPASVLGTLADIKPDDGVLVETAPIGSGLTVNQRFVVTATHPDGTRRRLSALQVALDATNEVFP
jgi:hypothetical protein